MVVPLYGRGETVVIEDIETKGRAMIERFEFLVFHRADPGPKEHQVRDGPMSYNRYIILNKIWGPVAADWARLINSVSQSVARYDRAV